MAATGLVLHRFPGRIGRTLDFDLFEKDGAIYVAGQRGVASPKGLTFLFPDEALTKEVHASFNGQCYLTQPSVSVSPRFEMKWTHDFSRILLTPEQRQTLPRRDWPEPVFCGQHYRWLTCPCLMLQRKFAGLLLCRAAA